MNTASTRLADAVARLFLVPAWLEPRSQSIDAAWRRRVSKLDARSWGLGVKVVVCAAVSLLAACGDSRREDELTPFERNQRRMEQEIKEKQAAIEANAKRIGEEYAKSGTPAERLAKFNERSTEELKLAEERWRKAKALSIAVAEGKASPPPSLDAGISVQTQPSEVVDGGCPQYDGLKIGSTFKASPETATKYKLSPGFYELDGSCRPVRKGDLPEQLASRQKEASRCPAPYYGFYVQDRLTIDPGEEKYFGYPPGIYAFGQSCTLVILDSPEQVSYKLRDAANAAALERLSALQRQSHETAAARQQKARAEGRLESAGLVGCPSPYQQYKPQQPVLVTRAGIPAFPIPGNWWIDVDCKATWYGPLMVQEPAATTAIKKSEARNALIARMVSIAIGVLLLVLLAHFSLKRLTGYGLIAWLTGRAMRRLQDVTAPTKADEKMKKWMGNESRGK